MSPEELTRLAWDTLRFFLLGLFSSPACPLWRLGGVLGTIHPPGTMGRPSLMWARSGKESLEEDSLTDLRSHFYGNEVARAECLILFWAAVAANYRQLCVPLLFSRKVSIYLLASFIYFFPLLDCILSPLFSLHPLEKKNLCCIWGMFAFLVVMEMKSQIIEQAWEGKNGQEDPR